MYLYHRHNLVLVAVQPLRTQKRLPTIPVIRVPRLLKIHSLSVFLVYLTVLLIFGGTAWQRSRTTGTFSFFLFLKIGKWYQIQRLTFIGPITPVQWERNITCIKHSPISLKVPCSLLLQRNIGRKLSSFRSIFWSCVRWVFPFRLEAAIFGCSAYHYLRCQGNHRFGFNFSAQLLEANWYTQLSCNNIPFNHIC